MNCSKVVAALLAIILMVVILSGCGGSTGTETQPTTSEPPAVTTSAPPAVTTTSTAAEPAGSDTVYIGETGTKFHTINCQYLAGTKTPLTRDEANGQGYDPCPFCKP